MNLHKNKAFSLAEMMIVMLILSIVLAAATPIITHRVIANEKSGSESGDNIPAGVILIWSGSASTIPTGWHLCDGTNGTPDLRSRFVYGAGGDTNTKPSFVSGWDTAASGHWAIGYKGGEEQHILTTNEMPAHSHTGYTDTQGNHNHSYAQGYQHGGGNWSYTDFNSGFITGYTSTNGAHAHNVYTYNTGSNVAHNILPRFYCLAYHNQYCQC